MTSWYLRFTADYPWLSTILQVVVCGMAGELLAAKIQTRRWSFFGPGCRRFALKLLVWVALGAGFRLSLIVIYAVFAFQVPLRESSTGFVAIWVPALLQSLFLNLIFGPPTMLFHRTCDNALFRRSMNWRSMRQTWFTIVWFWIPAQTLTFSLPRPWQVALAAVWGTALGGMLGFFSRAKREEG